MVKPVSGNVVLLSSSRRDTAWVERSGHAPVLVVHSNDDVPKSASPIAPPPDSATRIDGAGRPDTYVRRAFAFSVAAHVTLAGALFWLLDRPEAATPVVAIEMVFAPQADVLVDNAGPDVLGPSAEAEKTVETPPPADPTPQEVVQQAPQPPEPEPPPVAEAPPPEPTPEPVLVTEPPPEIKVERPPEPKTEPLKPKPPKPKPVKLVEPKPVQVAVTAPAATPPDSAPAKFDTGLSSMTQQADASPAAPLVSTEKVPQEAEVPVINNPRFRRTPTPPPYPRRAKEMDQQGVVIVRALISPDGTMGQVVIWKSSGYSMLDDSAKRAVEGWAFEPARVNGRAIEAWVELPVNFRLH